MNARCVTDLLVEDKLFSTLDTTVRRSTLKGNAVIKEVLLTDTVGFIQKLPAALIAAFRATLEELEEASLLLEVVDITDKNATEQSQTVEEILEKLGLGKKPRLLVLNKIDLLPELEDLELPKRKDVVLVSAARGTGLEEFKGKIAKALEEAQLEEEVGLKEVRTIDVM